MPCGCEMVEMKLSLSIPTSWAELTVEVYTAGIELETAA